MLIQWIYGAEFTAAGPILSLYICTVVLAFLQTARSQYLLAEDTIGSSYLPQSSEEG